MKITFILPTASISGISGGIRVVLIHAKALQDSGHDVLLVFPPIRKLSFAASLGCFFRGKGWRRIANWETGVPSDFAILDEQSLKYHVLERWRPVVEGDVPDADVIIATWWETAEWISKFSAKKGIKVYLIQGYEIFSYEAARADKTYWLPLHKVVVSKWLQDVMRIVYRDDCCSLVENGVDPSQFNVPQRSKQSVYTVGMLISAFEGKNSALAINAIIQAKKMLPNLRVIAFGAYPPPNTLPQWVEYHIRPSQTQIPLIYATCDVWLFTSRSEGFGLPILEAMASRTPVLATYAGAAPEIISANNGRLLSDSAEAFVQAMIEFAHMSDVEWRGISDNAHKKAQEYSWEISARKFELTLTNLLSAKDT